MPHQLSHTEFPFSKRSFPITLICDHLSFQPNIGSVFRICEAFGVEKIVFIGENLALTPRKINKTSRSTHLRVPYEIIETTNQAVQYIIDNNLHVIALEITADSLPLRSAHIPTDKPIALIAGSEISGISNEFLELADQTIHIEMFGSNSSMNVVHAIAIALYDITGKLS